MTTRESYREIALKGSIDLVYKLAKGLKERSILHVNSTRLGGGVAETVHRFILLFQ